MDSNSSSIESIYRQRADKFSAAEKRYANLERMVMHLRVATFIGAAVMFALGWNSQQQRLWYMAGCIAIAGFFALVAYHVRVRRQIERYRPLHWPLAGGFAIHWKTACRSIWPS